MEFVVFWYNGRYAFTQRANYYSHIWNARAIKPLEDCHDIESAMAIMNRYIIREGDKVEYIAH